MSTDSSMAVLGVDQQALDTMKDWSDTKKADFVQTFEQRARVAKYLLRALAVGRITSRDVAKAVYGTDTKEALSRATVVLYNLEKLGRASSIVLDTDRTFARRKAWAITQKGKNFLDSKG